MRIGWSQLARALMILLLAGCVATPALAQRGGGPGKGKRHPRDEAAREARDPDKAGKKQQRALRGMVGLPPHWLERLREMSPEEQERFMNNNERFQKLLPERQAQIRRRLQQWNTLTPEQRAEFLKREQVWRQMSPEQQHHVREELLPKWQQLPPERRQAILRRLRVLREMNESERAAKLNDPAFLHDLSADEQQMLRELSNLRVGAPPEPPPDHP